MPQGTEAYCFLKKSINF